MDIQTREKIRVAIWNWLHNNDKACREDANQLAVTLLWPYRGERIEIGDGCWAWLDVSPGSKNIVVRIMPSKKPRPSRTIPPPPQEPRLIRLPDREGIDPRHVRRVSCRLEDNSHQVLIWFADGEVKRILLDGEPEAIAWTNAFMDQVDEGRGYKVKGATSADKEG